jgi:hypothetical protein
MAIYLPSLRQHNPSVNVIGYGCATISGEKVNQWLTPAGQQLLTPSSVARFDKVTARLRGPNFSCNIGALRGIVWIERGK